MLASAGYAVATPANKKALAKHFGPLFQAQLDSCATCHQEAEAHGAESLEDFPHNPFGDRLRVLRDELKAAGEPSSLSDRLQAAAPEDSDGDGASNLDELLLGTNPGRAGEKPDVASLAEVEAVRQRFREFQDRYPWEPFKPVSQPAPPAVAGAGWGHNEIDAFIAAQHQVQGLKPRPEEEKGLLLRRVTLDLTGLLPTPEEVRAFLADDSPQAYEAAVDRLLESPRHGERWGRHWMDVWRYSDWAGYKDAVRNSQPHIWRWRDWIVEALNGDKGYDEMILEMLAADEWKPLDEDALRATGYLVRNYDAGSRDIWLDNVVSHTSQAFMGVTMGCVRCHDHMYDPFPQQEYYSLRAIFESYNVRTDRVPGELDTAKNGLVRSYDQTVSPKTYLFERGDERYPVKDQVISPAVPVALGGEFEVEQVKLPSLAYQPAKRPFVKAEMMAAETDQVADAEAALAKLKAGGKATPEQLEEAELRLTAARKQKEALASLLAVEKLEDGGKKDSDEWKSVATKTAAAQREAALLQARYEVTAAKHGVEKYTAEVKDAADASAKSKYGKLLSAEKTKLKNAEKALAEAEKKGKEPVDEKYEPRELPAYPASSTGRRLAFARWLTDRRNPLTARVAMNHIWLRHFGSGIVPTPNEFGANGQEPTHPALLDWLAAEFMARDWSMKEMHRLIVTSATYRQSSTPDPENLAKDPDNRWLWRMPSRRMEGELVRDNLIFLAGALDETMGGPDIDNTLAQDSPRRSIYLRHAHEKLVEFVQIFDGPKVSECYQREESVQPHQALAMANSKLTSQATHYLAERLTDADGEDDGKFIEDSFLHILSRLPTAEEQAMCREFLKREAKEAAEAALRRRENLVLVLLNHNDFVTVR